MSLTALHWNPNEGKAEGSTACLDWEERIVSGQSLIPFPPLFPETSAAALDTFNSLLMVDAANSPTFGEICRPWISDFVSQIFGSYDVNTGKRHIREYFLLISKKNGKSTTAAGIMLTALILNWREEAEFIILAPTKEVADNSYKPMAAMIRKDDELSAIFHVSDHTRTITHLETRATLKVVAADSATVAGKKATGVLVDELWQFGKDAKADQMLLEAVGGLASRPEGFVIFLTTQSDDPPAGIFKEKLDYARGVRDGNIHDPKFLPVLYEFPTWMWERKLYRDPKNWYITNPNLDTGDGTGSVDVDYITREWGKANHSTDRERQETLFLAKHLNVEIGLNLMADRWPGADFWEAAAQLPKVTVDYMIEHCEVIAAGIDGGGLDDLLGAALVGRKREFEWVTIPEMIDPETGELIPEQTVWMQRWVAWMHAWAHPSVLKRRMEIAPRLRDFAGAKHLTLVHRVGQDTVQLARVIKKVDDAGLLYLVGMDPNCIGGIRDAILQEGVEPEKMVKVNQGYTLAGAIRTTERKLAELVLIHDGNPMSNWCVSNAKVVVRGNSIVVTKQVSGTAKIDPLMALFNAVELMSLNPPAMNDTFDVDDMVIAG